MAQSSLTRVVPGIDPGIRRVPDGAGFRYVGPDSNPVGPADAARCRALVLPPAWTDVWISADPLGHIQATGVDAAGREQYRYHPAWQRHRAHAKYDRALELAAALPHARGTVTRAIRHGEGKDRVLGVAFRILDDGSPRVGSIEYLERYGSRGLTTLERRDATVESGLVTLSFPAKEHLTDVLHLHDAELAEVVGGLARGEADGRLLSYAGPTGPAHLTPTEVNDHVRAVTGGHFSAKDFRTLRGTVTAAASLARTGTAGTAHARAAAEAEAARAASEALCNTPTVARHSYIDPRVFEAYERGRLLDLRAEPDAALLRLIPLQPGAAD